MPGNRNKTQKYFEREHADFDATYSHNPGKIKDFVRWAQYRYGKKHIKGRLQALVDLVGDNIQNSKILEVGFGPGYYSIELAKKGAKVTGIDYSKGMVEVAKHNARKDNLDIDFKESDVFDLHSNAAYECVFATGVIEYVERSEHERFLKKLRDLSNNIVIVSFPKRYVLHAFIRFIWLRFLKGFRISYFIENDITRLATNCGLQEIDRRDVGILWVIKFKKV